MIPPPRRQLARISPGDAPGMTPGELEGGPAAGRECDHHRPVDSEMIEQQGVAVRLAGWGGAAGERGAEVAEARWADHPEPGAGKVRPPAIDGVDVAAEDSVGHQQRQPLALIGVLDEPEAGLEPLRGERVDAVPRPAHVVAIGGHRAHLPVCPGRPPVAASARTNMIKAPSYEGTGAVRARSSSEARSPAVKTPASGQLSRSAITVMLNCPA